MRKERELKRDSIVAISANFFPKPLHPTGHPTRKRSESDPSPVKSASYDVSKKLLPT